MPIVPVAPPLKISPPGGFDYVTVDVLHRRVYAAHAGRQSLLIMDADKGVVLGTVQIGDMAGSAPDLATGHVYTGDGDGKAFSDVDPVARKELRRTAVSGPVDAIAYDPQLHRIYGDEDDGTQIFVLDSRTFKQIGSVSLPGHKPEYLQINAKTHEIYQNIASDSEMVVIDPKTLKVSRTIRTPEIKNNHPLQYDAPYDMLLVAGENKKMSGYRPDGTHLWTIDYPTGVDQCDFDAHTQLMACAGTSITLLKILPSGPAKIVGSIQVSRGLHTVAIDPVTGDIWAVWSVRGDGSYVQRFRYRP